MRNICKSVLLITVLVATLIPERLHAQASTQGKEFWVSSTIVCSPGGSGNKATPYLAISAEKACTVTITGNGINITQNVRAGSWNEFGNANADYNDDETQGPLNIQMDASKWYPVAMSDADNVRSLAGQKNMYGLHVTATENISVYVILSSLNSMDASNILPVTALGSEYYTQDYSSIVKSDFSNTISMITILAIEDNTQVDITPNGNTYDGHTSGQTYQISLNKGQTYYVMSEVKKQFTGTHIQAKGGKKIAIFNGIPLTNIPTNIAARDCLFEQSMPIDYWGTQFIVARSLGKNVNLIGITATQRGTEIKIDGYTQAYINEGETYYIMLQDASDPNARDAGTGPIDKLITADVAYIETSCPCAVYSYDVGNGYRGKDMPETLGDPSSVWVSPLQQKINRITFGTCYTTKTKDHFLNIITETATCQNTTLTSIYGARTIDKTPLLSWTPVPGNTTYSYARVQIGDAGTADYKVFRLENPKGFIANIYGNGDDESYAYSAGSAAVEQGVKVNGETFTNFFRSDSKFCVGDDLEFDAKVGTDEIVRVDWDFGDGISVQNGDVQTTHAYNVPGWYDARAQIYGHQVCTDEADQFLGSVQFSFRVVRPTYKFVPTLECLEEDAQQLPKNDTIWPQVIEDCSAEVEIPVKVYAKKSSYTYDLEERDQAFVNGQWYYSSQEITWTTINKAGCDSTITCNLRVITCLDLSITNDSANQHICPGESFSLPYTKTKGDIGEVRFVCGNVNEVVDMSNDNTQSGIVYLPTEQLTQPGIYKAKLLIEDQYCDNKEVNLDLAVYYPSDIFKYKYNNVLAVYKNGFGGNTGYDFVAYQWYRNGEPIDGAIESIYHTEAPYTAGDEYYVVLTDTKGVTLPSCPQTIEEVPDFTPQQAPQKMLINQRMYIKFGQQMYDIFGQKVK